MRLIIRVRNGVYVEVDPATDFGWSGGTLARIIELAKENAKNA